MLDEENKVLEEETLDEEEVEVSPEEEQELESGIVAGLTDVDTVPLVKESFLDYAINQFIEESFILWRKTVILLINHLRSALVSSVTLWVNITLMVTKLSMVR